MNKDAAPIPDAEVHQAVLDIRAAGYHVDEFTFNGWKVPFQENADSPNQMGLFVEVNRIGYVTRMFRRGADPSWNAAFSKELLEGGFGPS